MFVVRRRRGDRRRRRAEPGHRHVAAGRRRPRSRSTAAGRTPRWRSPSTRPRTSPTRPCRSPGPAAQPTVSGPVASPPSTCRSCSAGATTTAPCPDNPGPPPEQCEQGAVAGDLRRPPRRRCIPSGFAIEPGHLPIGLGELRPERRRARRRAPRTCGCRSAPSTATKVDIQTDPNFNPAIVGGNFWLNPFFNIITTNEIAGGGHRHRRHGRRAVRGGQRASESSGLGCGQSVAAGRRRRHEGAEVLDRRRAPRHADRGERGHARSPTAADQFGVATSPLSPAAWQHRIAIPIDFNAGRLAVRARGRRAPDLGQRARPARRDQLAAAAVHHGRPAAVLVRAGRRRRRARSSCTSGAPGAPGMVVVSRPIAPTTLEPRQPGGLRAAQRVGPRHRLQRRAQPATRRATPRSRPLAGVRVADLNLTPRLVAKLLTQSYQRADQHPGRRPPLSVAGGEPGAPRPRPRLPAVQPGVHAAADRQRARPSAACSCRRATPTRRSRCGSGCSPTPRRSAWLDGAAGPVGHEGEPGATPPRRRPTRRGSRSVTRCPTSFPKSDPYCYQAPASAPAEPIMPPPLCGTDWMPYTPRLRRRGAASRASPPTARKIVENPFAQATSDVWTPRAARSSSAAARCSASPTHRRPRSSACRSARLSRAGDDGANAHVHRSRHGGPHRGRRVDACRQGEGRARARRRRCEHRTAYPLTMMTYAAIAPLQLDAHGTSGVRRVHRLRGHGRSGAGARPGPTAPRVRTLVACVAATGARRRQWWCSV